MSSADKIHGATNAGRGIDTYFGMLLCLAPLMQRVRGRRLVRAGQTPLIQSTLQQQSSHCGAELRIYLYMTS